MTFWKKIAIVPAQPPISGMKLTQVVCDQSLKITNDVACNPMKTGMSAQWFNHLYLREPSTVLVRVIPIRQDANPTKAPTNAYSVAMSRLVPIPKMSSLLRCTDRAEIMRVIDDAMPSKSTKMSRVTIGDFPF